MNEQIKGASPQMQQEIAAFFNAASAVYRRWGEAMARDLSSSTPIPPEPVVNLGDTAPYVRGVTSAQAMEGARVGGKWIRKNFGGSVSEQSPSPESLPCKPPNSMHSFSDYKGQSLCYECGKYESEIYASLASPRPEWLPEDAKDQIMEVAPADNLDDVIDLVTRWYNEHPQGRPENIRIAYEADNLVRKIRAERDEALNKRGATETEYRERWQTLQAECASAIQEKNHWRANLDELLNDPKHISVGDWDASARRYLRERDKAIEERDAALEEVRRANGDAELYKARLNARWAERDTARVAARANDKDAEAYKARIAEALKVLGGEL